MPEKKLTNKLRVNKLFFFLMFYLWKTGQGGDGGVCEGQLSCVCSIVYDVLDVLFMSILVRLTYFYVLTFLVVLVVTVFQFHANITIKRLHIHHISDDDGLQRQ